MSGGFFRGTSADQDTRFSNKQAKLLKSQKFPPELDHLVDMTKVKMDVIRPWIATRATELLGFEDEVLINFVYGLLDKKEVDGKQIQIQLTGFMEKNTGKFMKELWCLLLSAQNNVSGVPQQFLDAKEEETRKKKAETDRIAQEIQKRRDRDSREPERERRSGFDGEGDSSKFTKDASDLISKFSKPRASSVQPEVDVDADKMHGSVAKNGRSRSPHSNDHSPSPARVLSPTRSNNKSILRSRSNSEERHKSRSLSVSSQSPRHSVSPRRHYQSPERRSRSPRRHYRSPPRRSISPRRRHSTQVNRSPLRRRSPHLRRRSRSRQRSPSPSRYRFSIARRRSPRRRSPSPYRRRSPPRRRSPSPYRRRSPSPHRRRSPSPLRRRSPVKARRRSPSPVRRRSPIRQRSVSPARGMSTSPLRRRSPPPRSPKHRQRSPKNRTAESPISPPPRKRSPSPYSSHSPSPLTRTSLSRERDSRTNGNDSRRYRNEQTSRRDEKTSRREDAKKSPANHILERELAERSKQKVSGSVSREVPISIRSPQRDMENRSGDRRKMPVVSPENSLSNSESPTDMQKVNPGSVSRKVPISLRSPHRGMENRSGDCRKMPVVSPENSLSNSESPTAMQKVNPRTTRRSLSLSKSPIKQTGRRMPHHDIQGNSEEEEEHMTRARNDSSHKRSRDLLRDASPEAPDRRKFRQSPSASGRLPHSELKKKDRRQESDVSLPERHAPQLLNLSEETDNPSGRAREERGTQSQHDKERSIKLLKRDASLERMEHHEQVVNDESRHRQSGDEYSELHRGTESTPRSKKKMDKKTRLDNRDSESEETDSFRNENIEKRRHKKSDKRKRDYDETSESDSQIEDKKEAKRRRKDEKKQRKEEKRRRREERHRRKLERRASKMKMKSIDTVSPPSDFVMDQGGSGDSDGGAGMRKGSHRSKSDEAESEQKKLEIELREKALESLRAKKAISN